VHHLSDAMPIRMLVRKSNRDAGAGGYSIGRLLSPRDESIDVDEATWTAALALTKAARRADPARFGTSNEPDAPSGGALREVRGLGADGVAANPRRGLLLLYLLDPAKKWTGLVDGAPPVVAFGISFPGSNSGRKVEYKVNNVLWESEYGAAD